MSILWTVLNCFINISRMCVCIKFTTGLNYMWGDKLRLQPKRITWDELWLLTNDKSGEGKKGDRGFTHDVCLQATHVHCSRFNTTIFSQGHVIDRTIRYITFAPNNNEYSIRRPILLDRARWHLPAGELNPVEAIMADTAYMRQVGLTRVRYCQATGPHIHPTPNSKSTADGTEQIALTNICDKPISYSYLVLAFTSKTLRYCSIPEWHSGQRAFLAIELPADSSPDIEGPIPIPPLPPPPSFPKHKYTTLHAISFEITGGASLIHWFNHIILR